MRSGREAYGIGIAGPPDPGMRLWRSRLLAELASRGNSSPKALFVNRDQTAHGIGIARHPGLKIIESLTELASRAFFRGIGIAIKKLIHGIGIVKGITHGIGIVEDLRGIGIAIGLK